MREPGKVTDFKSGLKEGGTVRLLLKPMRLILRQDLRASSMGITTASQVLFVNLWKVRRKR